MGYAYNQMGYADKQIGLCYADNQMGYADIFVSSLDKSWNS